MNIEELEDPAYKIILIFVSILVFILGFIAGYLINSEPTPIEQCSIPSDKVVDEFCQENGYKFGWLSGECGEDSVMCYKKIGNAEYYDCLNIKGDD